MRKGVLFIIDGNKKNFYAINIDYRKRGEIYGKKAI